MADCKKYKDYGIPLLNQGGWEVIGDYVRFTGDYRYQERICTINYVPNFHPNTITITGIANKELEVAVLILKNNNYVIAEMGWYENGYTFDIGNDYDKLGVAFRYADGSDIALNDVTIEEVGAWLHSLRKLTTATDTITTLPVDIYADGNNATVGLKGNTVQNGTPTPDNPIMPEGTGERTKNLWNYVIEQGGWIATPGSIPTKYVPGQDHYYDRCRVPHMIPIPSNTMSFTYSSDIEIEIVWIDANGVTLSDSGWQQSGFTVTAPENATTLTFIFRNVDRSDCSPNDFQNIMLNTGSTALPYEPYGYKIPILINETITNIYIGNNPLRKSLDGTAYDTLAADGTLTQRVDSDGSVLATPIVTQITMPTFTLADGANTVSVDTTVQPSEMTMTYRGWHDATVKEWDGSQWN